SISTNYKVASWLDGNITYRYGKGVSNVQTHNSIEHYFTRNLINRGTAFQEDKVVYHFPYGGILNKSTTNRQSHYGRAQLNVNAGWARHHIYALAGIDIQEEGSQSYGATLYGYDDNRLTFANS